MTEPSLRKLYPWFTVLSLLVGGLVIVAFYKDQFREWKGWQRVYIHQEMAKAVTADQREAAAHIPVEIRQIVLPELGRVDRCTTCHIAVEEPSYAGFKQPVAYHVNHAQHPFQKFGCTICHQGQGYATTRDAAHGQVPHWEHPMLPMKYIEAACAKCHFSSEIPNAPNLARGRAAFEKYGCIGCHKLHGVGGNIGPELDTVGARRSPEWLARHFEKPSSVVPGSAMPPFEMSKEDVEALTLYMLGQTGDRLSAYYVSMKTIPSAEAGRRIFRERGCIGCHSIGGKGGTVGPSLDAVGKRRDAKWIVQHFRDPQSVSPGSVMPKFDFTEQESRALTAFLLSLSDPGVVGFIKTPSEVSAVERGRAVFVKYGCAGCHNQDGKGGIPNPNAKTAQQVPGLKYVGGDYTKDELKKFIMNGQREIPQMDAHRPPPPLYMPAWKGRIAEGELNDLADFLMSLKPKDNTDGF